MSSHMMRMMFGWSDLIFASAPVKARAIEPVMSNWVVEFIVQNEKVASESASLSAAQTASVHVANLMYLFGLAFGIHEKESASPFKSLSPSGSGTVLQQKFLLFVPVVFFGADCIQQKFVYFRSDCYLCSIK